MTGDELGVAAQRVRDGQVADAVAEALEAAAKALETAAWADEGPYARDAAALVRSFAPWTVDGGAQMPARPAVRHGDEMNGAVGGAGHPQPRGGELRVPSDPHIGRIGPMPAIARYDLNPTVDSRDPQAYAEYATKLDDWVPGWHLDDLDRMAPGLAEQAQVRRAASRCTIPDCWVGRIHCPGYCERPAEVTE